MSESIFIGAEAGGANPQSLEPARANRHGLIAKPSITDKMITSATRAAASSIGRQIGNQLLRGILGGLLRGR